MTITSENIAQINHVGEKDLNEFNHFMLHSISLSFDDDRNSIEQKIKTIDFLKGYLLKSIKIDTLPSNKEKVFFIKLLSKLSAQKEDFEILIGRTSLEALEKANKTFAKKTQFPVGISD